MRALPIALLVSACSIGTDDVGVVPVTIRSLPPLDVEAEIAAQQSDPGARAELAAALMAIGDSYEYETTVMIGGSVMMLVTGEVAGSAEESRVARGESVVEYLRTDDGQWVLRSGDQRLPVDGITTGTAPLEGLVGSAALNVDHDRVDGSVLQAVYRGGAVGAPGVDEVDVQVTIRDGMVSRVRYDVPVEGVTARVVTVISAGEGAHRGNGQAVRAAK